MQIMTSEFAETLKDWL